MEVTEKDYTKLQDQVQQLREDFDSNKLNQHDRFLALEYGQKSLSERFANMEDHVITKIEEVKRAVNNKEGITFLVQSELDKRYASKLVETWFYRILWTVVLSVISAVMYLLYNNNSKP